MSISQQTSQTQARCYDSLQRQHFGSSMVFDPTRAGKSLCACGNVSDTFGGLCDRCVSLQTLGLNAPASPEQIEKTYFTLVKVWHPDRFAHDPRLRSDAEEKLKEINAAHDYLLAHPRQTPQSAPPPERPPQRPFEPDPGFDLDGEETDEVKRILRRRHKSKVPAILIRVGFGLGAVAIIALVWLTGDSFLSSNSTLARSWGELKSEVKHDAAVKFTPGSTPPTQEPSATSAVAQPAPTTETKPALTHSTETASAAHKTPVQHMQGAKPYITAGLTPMEVLSVLGKPSSSTGEKMFYNSSEIDFKNGQVAGWNVDPASPIRVKLWSSSPSVPGLTTFGVGSTKSDVIALQGTPTFFSENEFGYGKSRILFQNNHVVSWKENSAAPLRVAH